MPPETPNPADFEARIARDSPLPVATPAGEVKGMLPGIAGIGLYLLLMAVLNTFAAVTGKFGAGGTVRYSVLGFCTLLVAGVFGLLRLRRWGWAFTIGGCLLMGSGNLYGFARTHNPPYLINGLFATVFFLYLSRAEIRERMR